MGLVVGAAKCKVDLTNAVGFNMQGFAIKEQKATRIGMDFYSRAFTVADGHSGRVAIAVVDLWACTESIKKEVIARLATLRPGVFNARNVMVLGTHTHSGPAGISEYRLYNFSSGGFNARIRDAYADAIARSIIDAQQGESPGCIFSHRVEVPDCGRNRSALAYLNNPEDERKQFAGDTDTEMAVLEFCREQKPGNSRIGILSWYPIHGTDLGQTNTALHGDNKGVASSILEDELEFCPVAAFANANAGDVSGNVEFGTLPSADPVRARKHGEQQAQAVVSVLTRAAVSTNPLRSTVSSHYSEIDMSDVTIAGTSRRTFVPAVGLSMFAGSTADSIPPWPANKLSEGLVRGALDNKAMAIRILLLCAGSERDINAELLRYVAADNPKLGLMLVVSAILLLPLAFIVGVALEVIQKCAGGIRAPSFFSLTDEEKAGHDPKPITMVAKGLVPSRLPLQLIRIGDFVIAGVPGEITTMAGRRLRRAVKEGYDALGSQSGTQSHPTQTVVVAGYANAYSQYITTPEEYAKQHYEGASTLFGPNTLDAYIQEFCRLIPAE